MAEESGFISNEPRNTVLRTLVAVGAFYALSRFNYLLFHTLIEGFAIVVASLLYLVAVRTHKYSANETLLFIGISYLFVAFLDMLHTAAYKGMGVFPTNSADPATQLWIAGRALEALGFLAAGFLRGKPIRLTSIYLIYSALTALVVHGIFIAGWFPSCFQEGHGLTPFKIGAEYAIVAVLLISMLFLRKSPLKNQPGMLNGLQISILLTIVGELLFTLYSDVYGIANALGHLAKVASYIGILHVVLKYGFDEPYGAIFRELTEMSMTDSLTGLLNKRGFLEKVQESFAEKGATSHCSAAILFFDMDGLKTVNDTMGHEAGDSALVELAVALRQSFPGAIIGRPGGDEFIVLTYDPVSRLNEAQSEVARHLAKWGSSNLSSPITATCGVAHADPSGKADVENLIARADKDMYSRKHPTPTASF